MAKLPRVTQKIFAQNSDTNDVTVFGTAKNGNDAVFTKDISQIMNSDAFSQGWGSATLTDDAPFQEDMNGVQLALSQQLAYFFENGMPEWDENTTYYANTSFCQVNGVWYQSLTDNNIGNNPVNDTTNWYKIDLDKLNPDLSNLSIPGLDKLNQSKALETGSVSSDADVYADIQKYAHSTFDLSKFEVVGSPTITDDGIASGFSSNNRVETITLDTSKKNYHVKLSGIEYRGQQSFVFGNRNISKSQSLNLIFDINKIALFVSSTGDSWDIANYPSSSFIFEVNKVYDISFIREGGNTYKVIVFDHSLNQEFTIITISSELDIYNSPNKICIGSGSWEAYSGSIDLKQFSITVDDIPVFNGNKTGLYVAKPDNYTVEGSPTITDDGILTNCPSQNDYLSATIPSLSQFEKVRIEFELKVKEVPSSTRGIFNIPNDENPMTANSGTYAWLNSVGFNINLAYNGADNGTGSTAKYPIAIGDFIKVIAEGNKNSVGSIKVSKNNGVFNDLTLTQSNACNFQEATKLFLGITGVGRQMQSSAEFDINSFKIYGDGNLIYQPCLKIPYTESKTGSKIVDAAYRDRVQDMYEQYGYAPYYTIDEENENFTLPMGEIYGMIERKNNELNNPFSLFDYKYADAPIYNMSWLQANGNWYAKSVYVSAYEALVVENNSDITAGTTTTLPSGGSYTKRGLSVKVSTDEYTDTDFVINTTDETFRLPLKAALTPVTGGSIPVIGNGMAMGLTNAVNSQVITLKSYTDGAELDVNGGGRTLPYNVGGFNRPASGNVVGLSKDPTKSGVIADISASTGLYLYYYVGETTQSQYIINNSQKLNNDASNLTEPGKTNIKNLVYPDFNNIVSLPTTLNLVQQADKDCYLWIRGDSGSDIHLAICDANGENINVIAVSATASNVAISIVTPLIPKGTYFKLILSPGSSSLKKIYTTGGNNV